MALLLIYFLLWLQAYYYELAQETYSALLYIFKRAGSESLLSNRCRFGKKLSPEGKVDPSELPGEALMRKCLEDLLRSYGMQTNIIIPGEYEHRDFTYLPVADSSKQLRINKIESKEVT